MRLKDLNLMALFAPQENFCHVCQCGTPKGILCEKCQALLDAQRLVPAVQQIPKAASVSLCVACWKHVDVPKQLVHLWKYQADGRAAQILGSGMAAVLLNGPTKLRRSDLVIPVPLHPRRLKDRGYNQAKLLAEEICKTASLTLADHLLQRTKYTRSLVGSSRLARMKQMQNVFQVTVPKEVKNRTVLLVDDVLTTGATSSSCADALLAAGAREVYLITATRAQKLRRQPKRFLWKFRRK